MEIRRRTHETPADFAGHLHPVLRRVYAARGIADASELDLSLERLLPVGSLEGLDAATRLLGLHRDAGRVLIVGDFDADGATSTALLVSALRALHFAHVDFLVPNRFRFGYGLTPEIVQLAATRAPSLIVTVDNGVSSVAGVEAAREIGVPVLVTDHHLPGAVLPRAEVIVNPNLPGSRFQSPALAGVGVAFYVVAALAKALGEASFRAADYLDLVALGTVADMVPLDRNNRILVSQGIRRIRAGRCVAGIRALLESAGRNAERLSAADLGFAVAPRLNAAGRLTDMSVGIACLLADDVAEAQRLAAQLAQLNEERREIEQRMQLEAVELAAALRESEAAESPRDLPFRCELASRRRGPGGRQNQRPAASSGHRVCPRGGWLAARLGALRSRHPYTRRARQRCRAAARSHRPVRRACHGGGHDAARIQSARFQAGVRRRNRAAREP